jgi:hypothetical protein
MVSITAGEYVDAMLARHNRGLSALERNAYVQAADVALNTRVALNFKNLHGILMFCDQAVAGTYREYDVLDYYTCEVKKFPRPTAISQLVQKVQLEYEQMLAEQPPNLSTTEMKLEIWGIAARLRCIRPFRIGSARLSFLLQGQMNQARGFDFLCEEFAVETYRAFRARYQAAHSEFYGRSPGAI